MYLHTGYGISTYLVESREITNKLAGYLDVTG